MRTFHALALAATLLPGCDGAPPQSAAEDVPHSEAAAEAAVECAAWMCLGRAETGLEGVFYPPDRWRQRLIVSPGSRITELTPAGRVVREAEVSPRNTTLTGRIEERKAFVEFVSRFRLEGRDVTVVLHPEIWARTPRHRLWIFLDVRGWPTFRDPENQLHFEVVLSGGQGAAPEIEGRDLVFAAFSTAGTAIGGCYQQEADGAGTSVGAPKVQVSFFRDGEAVRIRHEFAAFDEFVHFC